MSELIKFDKVFREIIVGVDEAGRGPLAGPVVAAAVIVKDCTKLIEVNDSKKISEKKREVLYDLIMENCTVGIGIADNIEVDEINILNATFLAMNRALMGIKENYELILVDGNKKIKGCGQKQSTIIKGDSKSLSIAAASIIAKVTRDRIMKKYSEDYFEYGFEKHKGYGTKEHRDKIIKFGVCSIHRKSFLKNILNEYKTQTLF